MREPCWSFFLLPYRQTPAQIPGTGYITGTDNPCHVFGTRELIYSCHQKKGVLSSFQKCMAWIGLRQDVMISFMNQEPVKFPLHYFSSDWDDLEDYAGDKGEWGNLIVYHVADVLNHCCGPMALTMEDHQRLQDRGFAWLKERPSFYHPMQYEEADGAHQRFPVYHYFGDVPSKPPRAFSAAHRQVPRPLRGLSLTLTSDGEPILQPLCSASRKLPPCQTAPRA